MGKREWESYTTIMFGACLLWPCLASQKSNFSSNLTIVQPVTQNKVFKKFIKTNILCFQQMVIMVSEVKLNSILLE